MMWRGKFMMILWAAIFAGCSYPERAEDWYDDEDGGNESLSLVSVEFIKSHYRGYPYTFKENYRIKGCVVSTDRSGNYYKALSVVDGSGAIEIKIDCDRLFEKYMIGSLVEVACNGLTVGSYGGAIQLGTAPLPGYETGYILEEDLGAVIRITGASAEAVQPLECKIGGLRIDDVGKLVAFSEIQFREGVGAATWCDEDVADASGFRDTDREIIDKRGNTLTVRTSRYAEFASWTLPAGSGTIEGLLSVYNDKLQLRVIRPELLYSSMSEERF